MGSHQEHPALQTCPHCEFDAFVRNHYFTGKMMGAGEFTTETQYHGDKMRHHNVRLHGAGTVCGLRVHQHPSPDCRRTHVIVEPGSALDCCGHEILVPQAETLQVAALPAVQHLAADTLLHALQVCVRYRECPTEDVPVLYDECGCDDTACAPNRILESFELDVLVDGSLGDTLAGPAAGALTASDQHAITGWFRAGAGGLLALIPPADRTSLVILDAAHRSRRTVALGRDARALALSADGAHAFVVTVSSDAAPELEVRVFTLADGSEVGPVAPGTLRKLPNTDANSVLRAAGTTGAGRVLLVHVQGSGDLHPFAADAAHVIGDAPGAVVSSAANLSAFVATDDGSTAYAIDAAAQRVKIIDFSGNPPADLGGLPATARPSALAAFSWSGHAMLAVASRDEKRVYVVDRASNAVTPVDLQHPPLALGAVGDGATAEVWLHVLEEEAANLYVQAIGLAPLAAAGGTPWITAARVAGPGPQRIVLLGAGGAQAVVDPAALAGGPCGEHVWHQLDGCPSCEMPDCVVLATIARWRPGMQMLDPPAAADDTAQQRARIDNRDGRHIVASTASLQAWLECLQLQGGTAGPPGPAGPAGPGIDAVDATIVPCEQPGSAALQVINNLRTLVLRIPRGCDGQDATGPNVNLPKIIDIGWSHRAQLPLLNWLQRMMSVDANGNPVPEQQVIDAVRSGEAQRVPLFTIYFNQAMQGIDRQTFRVRVDMPGIVISNDTANFFGIYSLFGHEVYGNIIPVPGPVPTPHTGEQAAFAAVFVPRPEYPLAGVQLLVPSFHALAQRLQLEPPTVTITLKGEFVFAPDVNGNYTQDGVLDGENIGGRIGRNEVRGGVIQGGKNPSGNLAQGGRFESWFFVRASGDVIHDTNLPPIALRPPGPGGVIAVPEGERGIVNPNLASIEMISAIPGVSDELARRIVEARGDEGYAGVRALRERAQITDDEWDTLKDHLLIV